MDDEKAVLTLNSENGLNEEVDTITEDMEKEFENGKGDE